MRPVVVHVTGDTGLFGGKDRVLLWLLVALRDSGSADPHVACFRDGLVARTYRSHGLRVDVVPMTFQFDARAVFHLATLLRNRRARIVHTHDHKSHVVGRLAGRIARVPVVSTLHGLMRDAREMPWVKRAAYGGLVRATDRLTDRWIAVSRPLARELAWAPHVTYIPNGVDPFLACQGDDETLPVESAPVVACVGRLSHEKGQDVLLDAFATTVREVPGAVVWLAGEGPTEGRLREQSQRLGIEGQVRFLGFREHVAPILRKSMVVALPSRGEGLPIAVLEAMAMGVPVVASAVGGVRDLIDSDRVGVCVPPEDPPALAAALSSLLTDPRRARGVGEAGRAHVRAHFSADRMAEATAEVYRAALES